MSRNVLTCRTCGQPLVITQESGEIRFIARVERFRRHGPRGGCFWLVCPCGTGRDWIIPEEVMAA